MVTWPAAAAVKGSRIYISYMHTYTHMYTWELSCRIRVMYHVYVFILERLGASCTYNGFHLSCHYILGVGADRPLVLSRADIRLLIYFTWSILFVAILVQPYVGAQFVFCAILHFIVLLMTMLIDYFIIVLTRFVGPIYLWVVFGSSVVAIRVDSH